MFMDVGVGLIIAVLINMIFDPGNPNIYLVLFGAFAALAPDVDYLIYIAKYGNVKNRWTYLHRFLLHHPIPFVLSGTLLFSSNKPFAVTWFCCTLYHFIHDTFGAFGIRWLSPFYGFFVDLSGESPYRIHANTEELAKVVSDYGNDDWKKNMYSWNSSNFRGEMIFLMAGITLASLWLLK